MEIEKAIPDFEPSKEEKRADFIVSSGRAITSLIPGLGQLGSIIADYHLPARQKRVEDFLFAVRDELDLLENRIDQEYIKSDEFAYILEQCIKGSAENYQNEKLGVFRSVLINSALKGKIDQDDKEYFLSLVNNLTALHIKILRILWNPKEYLKENNIQENEISGGFGNFFPKFLPDVDINILTSAFEDLHRYDLINTGKSIFTTMTSGQGFQLLGGRLSGLGTKFIEFCSTS